MNSVVQWLILPIISIGFACSSNHQSGQEGNQPASEMREETFSGQPEQIEGGKLGFAPRPEAILTLHLSVPTSIQSPIIQIETEEAVIFEFSLPSTQETDSMHLVLDWNLYAGRCQVEVNGESTGTYLPISYAQQGISLLSLSPGIKLIASSIEGSQEVLINRKRIWVLTPQTTKVSSSEAGPVAYLPDYLHSEGIFTHIDVSRFQSTDGFAPFDEWAMKMLDSLQPSAIIWLSPSDCESISSGARAVFCSESPALASWMQAVQNRQIPMIVSTPNPVSRALVPQKRQEVEQLGRIIRNRANQYSMALVDPWTTFEAYDGREGHELEDLLSADGIYPNEAGNLLIAEDLVATLSYLLLYQNQSVR